MFLHIDARSEAHAYCEQAPTQRINGKAMTTIESDRLPATAGDRVGQLVIA
jgi:hypothetical protein